MNPLNSCARRKRGLATLAGAAAFAFVAGGCASAAPYNPAHLEQGQLQAVGGICQSAMGLSADERPIPGDGNPRLDPLENHYEGCVATLSHALEREGQILASQRAEENCVQPAKGADHALCVLKAADRPYAPARVETAVPTASPTLSSFWVTPREWRRRTERACASIGLDPAGGGFDSCVKHMTDTFYAIDNPSY